MMNMHQDLSHAPNLSYWELQSFFREVDFVVVGSGIVGLNAALYLKTQAPAAKVLVLERGILPYGASTKNAGFACFGSASEILSDIDLFGEELAVKTIDMRIRGLHYLRNLLGDEAIDYQATGGYELFFDETDYEKFHSKMCYLNQLYLQYFHLKNTWQAANEKQKEFQFNKVCGMIQQTEEGAIDTGQMMISLHRKCIEAGVLVLQQVSVTSHSEQLSGIALEVNHGFTFQCKKMLIATNGFASSILPELAVQPARAQVLITKPIADLRWKGTFHFDEGYYYFRNVGNRVLFGGGRNSDVETETSTEFQLNEHIQERLVHYLQEVILPHHPFEIEHRWTGIMGMGESKMPIIRAIGSHRSCAVKMGGMGVAIGSLAGVEAAKILLAS
jgi:glycine/D-amino acid oxidase-like deaminating enzyme